MVRVLLMFLCLAFAGAALAHPFDDRALMNTNVSIVSDTQVDVTVLYNFTNAASSYTEVYKLDANQDGFVSLAERDKRMTKLAEERLDNMELKVGGRRVKLAIDPKSFECLDLGNPAKDFSGPDTFPTEKLWLGYALGFKGTVTEAPVNGYFEGAFSYLSALERIEDPDGQFKVFDERVKPSVTLDGVKWDKVASGPYIFTFRYKAAATSTNPKEATPTPLVSESGARDSSRADLEDMANKPREDKNKEGFFKTLFEKLRNGEGDFSYWFFALAFVFGWGAWHALQPGHGKTLVASYLIGTQGRKSDALFLGLVVTLAHTSGVMLLLGGLAAVQAWMPDLFDDPTKSISEWMSVAVGATILIMGLGLVFKAASGNARHEHDIFGRHVHGEDGHQHEALDPKLMSRWEILRLGILGGIVPCPAAFVIALISIDQHMLVAGLILVLVFSLGLAIVLSTIGLVLVATKSYMSGPPQPHGPLYRRYAPWLTRTSSNKSLLHSIAALNVSMLLLFESAIIRVSRFLAPLAPRLPVAGALGITLIGFTMVLMALLRLGVLDMATFTA